MLDKRGDSLYGTLITLDTLYALSDSAFLRKFRNEYFINRHIANRGWEVSRVSPLKRKELFLGSFFPGDSLQAAQPILHEIPARTYSLGHGDYIFDVSKKEFRKMSRTDELWKGKTYFRIQ